jgi:hypothetical protein
LVDGFALADLVRAFDFESLVLLLRLDFATIAFDFLSGRCFLLEQF